MKPSVRPPSGKPPATSITTKPTGISGGLGSGRPEIKVESKLSGKVQVKGSLQKVPSYGQLKSNPVIGSGSSKEIPKAGKIGTTNSVNPELKQKPSIPNSSSVKSGLISKPLISSTKVQSNIPISKNPEPISKIVPLNQPLEAPIKKVGLTGVPPKLVQSDLQPCKQCGRTFNEKALALHEKICKKVFSQKRKEFNSAKQRIVSKEQVAINKKTKLINKNIDHNQNVKVSNIPKWKQESLALRAAMKNSRGQALSANEAVQLTQQMNSHLVPCKFCTKKFSEQAHAKHTVFCEKKAKQLAMMNKKKK